MSHFEVFRRKTGFPAVIIVVFVCNKKFQQKVNKIKATAIAHPNIALIKYWGKRDDELKLPTVSSLSMTLNNFYTKTTIEFSDKFEEDTLSINGKTVTGGKVLERVQQQLDIVRNLATKGDKRGIISKVLGKKPGNLGSHIPRRLHAHGLSQCKRLD